MSGPAGIAESTLRLSVPPEGLRAGDVVLRFPALDDVAQTGEVVGGGTLHHLDAERSST